MRKTTVILAAGDFPRKGGEPRRLLESADRVVCCDGAANSFRRRLGREPTVVIGDGDSIGRRGENYVLVPDQDTNDLEKAIDYCLKHRWSSPVIVGASGLREDHTLGNVFIALDNALELVTEHGRFLPCHGSLKFRTRLGAGVSVFAPNPDTIMTSTGLKWPLAGVRFDSLHRATLNRANRRNVSLTSNHPVSVFVEL